MSDTSPAVPTDEQLNEMMALACGRLITQHGVFYVSEKRYSWGYSEQTARDKAVNYTTHGLNVHYASRRIPDPEFLPCEDRNTLPEIWRCLLGTRDAYAGFIEELNLYGPTHWQTAWRYLTQATPRMQVIAALKALGKWPKEWANE